MGLLDSLFGSSAPTPASPPASGPMLPSYDDFQNNYRTSQILEGFHNGLFSGLAQLFGGATNSAPAAYMNMAMPVYRAQMAQAVLNNQPIPQFPFGTAQGSAPATQSQAAAGPQVADAGPSLLSGPPQASDASSGLLGGSGPIATSAPPSAPAAGTPAAAPAGPMGGMNPGTVRQAFGADLLFPGAGKDIIAKQFAGPTDAQRALAAAGIDPNSPVGQALLAQAARHATGSDLLNVRSGGYAFDPLTRQPIFYGAKLPDNMTYDPATRSAVPVPGAYQGAAINAGIQQGAGLARDEALKGYENRLEFGNLGAAGGQPPTVGGFGVGGMGGAGPSTATSAASASKIPPVINTAPLPDKPIQTAQGTTIPPATEAAPINNSGAYLKERIPQWAKTENAWGESLPNNIEAEQRTLAIADALKQTQSGSFATDKANIKAGLHAVGIDLPDDVWGSPAAVQTALKDNFNATLQTLKAFSSRATQLEVAQGAKNFANPDLQPEANQNIIAQTVGTLRWDRAMMSDWAQAKRAGWSDPQDFQRAWTKANPLQGFIDRTKAEIGPLKGMPGGPGSTPSSSPKTSVPDGTSKTVNGVNYVKRGGQWYQQ